MDILIAEDYEPGADLLSLFLKRAGHTVSVTRDGKAAWKALQEKPFDILIADWMMPRMDGVELIQKARQNLPACPAIVMLTTLTSEQSRIKALESGADAFISKPYAPREILEVLKVVVKKNRQRPPDIRKIEKSFTNSPPPFVGVVMVASTGGPSILRTIFKRFPPLENAVVYLVLHGPDWMLQSFQKSLAEELQLGIEMGRHNARSELGRIYLAPGDRHLVVHPKSRKMLLEDTLPENFVKPSADPLFRSAAAAFGEYCLGVVLTGLGKDGSQGAAHIAKTGGLVIAQDPASAPAPSMPKAVVDARLAHSVFQPDQLKSAIEFHVKILNKKLQAASR